MNKQLQETDFVIYDQWNAEPIRFTSGAIAIYGKRKEAVEDCLIGHSVIRCTDLPSKWQDELLIQLNMLE